MESFGLPFEPLWTKRLTRRPLPGCGRRSNERFKPGRNLRGEIDPGLVGPLLPISPESLDSCRGSRTLDHRHRLPSFLQRTPSKRRHSIVRYVESHTNNVMVFESERENVAVIWLFGKPEENLLRDGKTGLFHHCRFCIAFLPFYLSQQPWGRFKLDCESLEHQMSDRGIDPASRCARPIGISLQFHFVQTLERTNLCPCLQRPSEINAHQGVSLEIALTQQKKNEAEYQSLNSAEQGAEISEYEGEAFAGQDRF